jgi:hypothetical protein
MGVTKMDDLKVLEQKIDKLDYDHKSYVEFGSMCFIGLFASGMMIDRYHYPLLWGVVFLLFASFDYYSCSWCKKRFRKRSAHTKTCAASEKSI